jgi:hypothetical protein
MLLSMVKEFHIAQIEKTYVCNCQLFLIGNGFGIRMVNCKLHIFSKLRECYFPLPNGGLCASLQSVLERKYHRSGAGKKVSTPGFTQKCMLPFPNERRRSPRIHVQIPMFVRGADAAGVEFLDLTKALDISATGAFLQSPRLLRPDQLLNLTIPAPASLSSMIPSQTPPIQARVCRYQMAGGIHLLGVEFHRALD